MSLPVVLVLRVRTTDLQVIAQRAHALSGRPHRTELESLKRHTNCIPLYDVTVRPSEHWSSTFSNTLDTEAKHSSFTHIHNSTKEKAARNWMLKSSLTEQHHRTGSEPYSVRGHARGLVFNSRLDSVPCSLQLLAFPYYQQCRYFTCRVQLQITQGLLPHPIG
jgi:hypothetical protein